jgi:hypothetical protein
MRSATRLGIIVLLGFFLALPAVSTASAAPVARHAAAVDRVVAPPSTPPSSGASAPAGPKIKPDTAADKAEQRRKLIMGLTSVVLLVIVFWGRSVKRKRKKAAEANTGG